MKSLIFLEDIHANRFCEAISDAEIIDFLEDIHANRSSEAISDAGIIDFH